MRAYSLTAWSEQIGEAVVDAPVHRYQALESSSGIYRFGVQLYNFIQQNCPRLHHIYFNCLELFQISAHKHLLLGKQRYIQLLLDTRPDLIISVHAHTNHAFRAIAKDTLPSVRFVIYCGEMFGGYGFSRHWVDPLADAFIGATDAICTAAVSRGMSAAKVKLGGFVLNPSFYAAPLSKEQKAEWLSEELGMEPGQFTLLLSTGANGAQNHHAFIQALERAQLPIQVIALCGKNQTARKSLESASSGLKFVRVRALGYRDDMFQLMQVSDSIVARPGTGTTSESILAACPIIFNTIGGVMPQERITIQYLRSKGHHIQPLKKPKDLVTQVAELVHQPKKVTTAKAGMQQLQPDIKPPALFDYLVDLIDPASSL